MPSNPTSNKTLFLWNAIENIDIFMQSVLAWGDHFNSIPGESTGGHFWEIYNAYKKMIDTHQENA